MFYPNDGPYRGYASDSVRQFVRAVHGRLRNEIDKRNDQTTRTPSPRRFRLTKYRSRLRYFVRARTIQFGAYAP